MRQISCFSHFVSTVNNLITQVKQIWLRACVPLGDISPKAGVVSCYFPDWPLKTSEVTQYNLSVILIAYWEAVVCKIGQSAMLCFTLKATFIFLYLGRTQKVMQLFLGFSPFSSLCEIKEYKTTHRKRKGRSFYIAWTLGSYSSSSSWEVARMLSQLS